MMNLNENVFEEEAKNMGIGVSPDDPNAITFDDATKGDIPEDFKVNEEVENETQEDVQIDNQEIKPDSGIVEPVQEEIEKENDIVTDEEGIEHDLSGVPKNLVSAFRRKFDKTKQLEETLRSREVQIEQNTQLVNQLLSKLENSSVAQQEQTQVVENIPDKELDPDAWHEYKIKQLEEKTNKYEQILTEQQRAAQHQALVSQARQELQTYENQYAQTNKEFLELKEVAFEQKKREIKATNPNITDDQIKQTIDDSYLKFADSAVATGQHPIQAFHNYLKNAYGHLPRNLKQPVRDHDAIAKNQHKHKVIDSSGSSSGKAQAKSLEEIANMSSKEIQKYRKQIGEKKFMEILSSTYKS